MCPIRTWKGQMGYFWQCANYFWQFAKCCKTTEHIFWKVSHYWQCAILSRKVSSLEKVPILVIEHMYVSDQDLGGSGGALLAVCQLFLAACQMW